eukprot:319068-Prymnesium_polylepis.1
MLQLSATETTEVQQNLLDEEKIGEKNTQTTSREEAEGVPRQGRARTRSSRSSRPADDRAAEARPAEAQPTARGRCRGRAPAQAAGGRRASHQARGRVRAPPPEPAGL